jgi:ferric-chelate reductase
LSDDPSRNVLIPRPLAGHIDWISDMLLQALQNLPSSVTIDIRLFVTGPHQDVQLRTKDSADGGAENQTRDRRSLHKNSIDLLRSPFVGVHQGRPILSQLMNEAVAHAIGDISVTGRLSTQTYSSKCC